MGHILDAALAAYDAGLSVIPISGDGSKRPPFKWGVFRERRPSRQELTQWFTDNYTGFAVVCGPISNNLVILDFDDKDTYQAFLDTAEAIELDVVERIRAGCADRTPDDGSHLLFYCETAGGNTVLAARPGPDPARPKYQRQPLIETRGDGGYGIMAPSNGQVHPSGRAWRRESGSVETIVTISSEEQAELFALARSFDEMPPDEPEQRSEGARTDKRSDNGGMKPGEDFRAKHGTLETFTPLITKHGWDLVHRRNGVGYYRRPGKNKGISATFGHNGGDWFYVFTSSTQFDPGRGYNPFSVYAALEHNNDFSAAGKALARQGYGSQPNQAKLKQKEQIGKRREASDSASDASQDDQTQADESSLPLLFAQEPHLPTLADQSWKALNESNDPVRLVIFGDSPTRIDRAEDGSPIPQPLDEKRILHELNRSASWWKYAKDPATGEMKQVIAKAPRDLAHDMLAFSSFPLPGLLGIVQTPIFSKDGTLHTTPGYDRATKLFYDPPPGVFIPPVSDDPTVSEIEAAKALVVDELLGEFPFTDQADRANAVCVFIESVGRNLINGPTPLRMVSSPTPGTGKGLLVDATLRHSLGRKIGIMPAANDDDEWRKRITSQLVQAPAAIMIDNVTKPIDSGALAGALTADDWKDRKLGATTMLHLPVRCIWIATANNPTMSTEIARRTVQIHLDPKVDRPWTREGFKHPDLRSWIDANRGQLVWAALTLIRHWMRQGSPRSKKRLGSYEAWASIMGGILEAAEIDGFLDNAESFYETADAEGALWREFVKAWAEKFGNAEVGAGELFDLATTVDGFDFGRGSERAQKTAFGIALNRQRDRVIGDHRIVFVGTKQRAKRWRLLSVRPEDNPFAAFYTPSPTAEPVKEVNLVNISEPPQSFAHTQERESVYTAVSDVHSGSQGSPIDEDEEEVF